MSLNKASIAVALAAFLAVGGIAGQALAAPHDGHDGHWRQQRSYQDCIYQALTQEKKAQYDAIMKEFADKTAPLRDKLAAKYIELRTLGNSPTPDPKAIGKATEELVALRNEFAKERSAMVDRVAKEIGINIFQGKGPGCPVEQQAPLQPLVSLPFQRRKTLTPIQSGETIIGKAVYIYESLYNFERPVPPDRFTGA